MTLHQFMLYSWASSALSSVLFYGTAAVGLYLWKRARKKNAVEARIFASPCPVAGCRYTRGHLMPCWDGTPDPRMGERS